MYSTKTCTSSPTNSGLLIGLLVAQSCPTLCDPMNCGSPGSSVHGDSPGKKTGVACHALLDSEHIQPYREPCPSPVMYCHLIDAVTNYS